MTAAPVSITANSGVKSMVSTGAMFSTTRCFDSTSHAATITAPAAPEGSTHSTTRSARSTRGLEDQRGERQEHAAAERDQHVVDDPLAGEADEVHPPLVRPHDAAHVRVGDHEPQGDGQVGSDEASVADPRTYG